MANEQALLEDPDTSTEEVSLRDSLEAEFDKVEETPEVKSDPSVPPPAPTEAPEVARPQAATEAQPQVPTPAATEQPASPAPAELKAPSQWKPAVREEWNKLPRAVQEEIVRREGDSMRLIGSVGPKIRLADEVTQHLQPFAERLQQGGVAPTAFIGDVFNTVKTLASGSMEEKAEAVANIVQSYGIDLRVLDHLLTQRIQQPPEVLQARRLAAQAQTVLNNQQTQASQQTRAEADKAIAAFGADPKHEFFPDVRELMADLVEAGRANTLDDAYAAAIWAHPDTRKILLQREAEARTVAKNNRASAARRASASISGAPSTSGVASPNAAAMSLRESLEAAFDDHTSL
jgi:hypothetical protein